MGETVPVEKRFGRYRIIKHLASGGMAEVLLANATGIEGFERYVVIKRIHGDQARNAAFVQMFLDEARLAASLHHQHIVQVHDIGQDNGEYFFAMEYVHGEDLRSLLMRVSSKKEKVPIEHVVTILLAATAALHYAHEHRAPDRTPLKLVHRDVSPSNILVGYDGSIKVVDFGIAKAALRTDKTKSGVLKGKVAYMSPEQCKGKSLDRRSDIHALGIVLYELLTARRLFKGDSDFMTMSAIVASRIPEPSKHRPGLPPQLEEIVLKALAKAPQDRYQTADEMRRALEEFANAAGLRTSTSALGDYMAQQFGHRPEPWLIPDAGEPEIELTADFDGSLSGVADVPTDPFDEIGSNPSSPGGSLRESSPIMKARSKAISVAPPIVPSAALTGSESSPAPERPESATPMAWEPAPSIAKSRRPWLVAAIALPLVIAGVVFMTRGSGSDDAPRSTTRPASLTPGGTEVDTAPAADSEAPPATGSTTPGGATAEGSATVAGGSASETGSAAAGSSASGSGTGSAAVAGKALPPKRGRTGARPKVKPNKPNNPDVPWDPDNLLPE